MNLTKNNFIKHLPFIQDKIAQANFVAIDFEFSGICAAPFLKNQTLDSVQLRYWKGKENIKRFTPIQLGICAFIRNNANLIAYPFNFYIFPYLEKDLLFNSSAITFLSDFKFDFNQCFHQGIPYISQQDEKESNKYKKQPKQDEYYNENKQTVLDFLEADEQQELQLKFKSMKALDSFVSLLQLEYGEQHQFYTILENKNSLRICKGQSEKNANIIGVRLILDRISELRKPLIFHNGFFDLLYLYDKFYFDLPDSKEQFACNLMKLFPEIYDTKYILNQSAGLSQKVNFNSELMNSYKVTSTFQPYVQFGEQCSQYENSLNEHEAGFDAYMTGCVFIRAKQYLNLEDSKFQDFKNKIPLRGMKDILSLKDEKQDKQQFIYILEDLCQGNPIDEKILKERLKCEIELQQFNQNEYILRCEEELKTQIMNLDNQQEILIRKYNNKY